MSPRLSKTSWHAWRADMDQVYIQAQDLNGIWRTYLTVTNNQQRVTREMEQLQRRLSDYRIRCVDAYGRIIDLL